MIGSTVLAPQSRYHPDARPLRRELASSFDMLQVLGAEKGVCSAEIREFILREAWDMSRGSTTRILTAGLPTLVQETYVQVPGLELFPFVVPPRNLQLHPLSTLLGLHLFDGSLFKNSAGHRLFATLLRLHRFV